MLDETSRAGSRSGPFACAADGGEASYNFQQFVIFRVSVLSPCRERRAGAWQLFPRSGVAGLLPHPAGDAPMSSSLSSNAADRMVEVLAGSTALLANPTGGLTDLPLSVTSVLPEDSSADTTVAQPAHGLIDLLPATNALESTTSVLGDGTAAATGSDLPLVGSLLNTSDLPVVGSVLNTAMPVESDATALAASGGTLQPVLDTANTAALGAVHSAADILVTALPDALHGVTNLGQAIDLGSVGAIEAGGHTNLVADVLDVPGQLLAGNLGETIAHLGADITGVVHAVSGLANTIVSDVSGLLSPVTGLVNQLSHGLLDNGLPNLGGDISAIDTGQNGPHLLDLGALTGAHGLNIPNLGGVGADGLAGNLLGSLNLNLLGDSSASGHAASAPVAAPVDLGAVTHDLLSPLTHGHGILDAHGTHIL
ncbi:hypothetical protein QMZ05_32820 [Bradyrhizobium sp. INPA03-11B]|uniref:hypothetical protein n=1 Tax=Bradyrhizobium sp. INPA03-11B TaxID=418598 RepID=UPI00338EE1F3